MKQKLLSVLLALMVGVSGMYVQAQSYGSGTCGENLTWELTGESEYKMILTITGTGAMTEYTSESDVPWYDNRYAIRSVSLPAGITHISSFAFNRFANVTGTFTVPDGVESIGNKAFYSSKK